MLIVSKYNAASNSTMVASSRLGQDEHLHGTIRLNGYNRTQALGFAAVAVSLSVLS